MGGRDGVYGEKMKNSLTTYKDSIMSPPSALMGLPHREEAGHCPVQDLRTTNHLCFQGLGYTSHMVKVMATCLRGCKDPRQTLCFASHCFKTQNQRAKK